MTKKLLIVLLTSLSTGLFAQIPNASFENWGTSSTEAIDKWILQGDVTKSTSRRSGSFALRLDGDGATALYRAPYVGRPDTVSFWAKGYHKTGDSAEMIAVLQRQGNAFGFVQHTFALKDSLNFTEIKLPLTYFFPFVTADTIIIIFYATANGGFDTSLLIIDDVRVTKAGANEGTLQNPGFETWNATTFATLNNWITTNDIATLFGVTTIIMASQSSDAKIGSSALMLENKDIPAFQSVFPGAAISVDRSRINDLMQNNNLPGFPISERYHYLHGYFKYIPSGVDTANITVTMFKAGSIIGVGKFTSSTIQTAYKMFSVYIAWQTADMPDSGVINITAGSDSDPRAGSKLIVDSLSFGYAVGIPEFSLGTVNIFPNPANDIASIEFNMLSNAPVNIVVTNLAGSETYVSRNIALGKGYNRTDIETANLAAGMYLVKISAGDQLLIKKLVVAK